MRYVLAKTDLEVDKTNISLFDSFDLETVAVATEMVRLNLETRDNYSRYKL